MLFRYECIRPVFPLTESVNPTNLILAAESLGPIMMDHDEFENSDDDVEDWGGDAEVSNIVQCVKDINGVQCILPQLTEGKVYTDFLKELEESVDIYVKDITTKVAKIDRKLIGLVKIFTAMKRQMRGHARCLQIPDPSGEGEQITKSLNSERRRISRKIKALRSIVNNIENINIEDRLFEAQTKIKWLTVFVRIICTDFRGEHGNSQHPSFEKYSSPSGHTLSPGLLLELLSTMIIKQMDGVAERVGQKGDEGVDIWVGKDRDTICQVKNKSEKLSPSVIREFIGTMVLQGVKKGCIIYTQDYRLTPGASSAINKAAARDYSIVVVTTDKLVQYVVKYCKSFQSIDLVFETDRFDQDATFNPFRANAAKIVRKCTALSDRLYRYDGK